MAKLRKISNRENKHIGFLHWCPGCKGYHSITVNLPKSPNWDFDGNMESPSFHPSVRHFYTDQYNDDGSLKKESDFVEVTTCHYFIKKGEIQFCADCQHEFKGQTVPLPDCPLES